MAGFQIWSNIGGRPLDDPGVLPVLEHIASRGGAIHLHPTIPAERPGLDPATMTGFAFPADTSLGGVLPWLRDRLTVHGQASPPFPDQPRLARSAGEYLGRLYLDTACYEPAPLEYCHTPRPAPGGVPCAARRRRPRRTGAGSPGRPLGVTALGNAQLGIRRS
jgi:hypothetical protein